MRTSVLGALAAALLVAGCAARANMENEADPTLWSRVDCQRISANPSLMQEFEQAKAICLPRGQAAATAGTANMPGGYGLGGAIAAGINQGITANQIGTATITSCMGENGYLLKRKSEQDAMCEAIADQRP